MTINSSNICWGKYNIFEGPYYPGRYSYVLPTNPDFLEKSLAVLAATEGGRYDAINMYDSCILTVGIIQVCERVYNLSNLLSACKNGITGANQLFAKLPKPLVFKKNNNGINRFFYLNTGEEVNTEDKMRDVFLGGSTGKIGEWSSQQKDDAKAVAVIMATVWDDQVIRDEQKEFVKGSLLSYVRPKSRSVIWDNTIDDGWSGALKSMVISYSANLPSLSDKLVLQAVNNSNWSQLNWEDRFRLVAIQMATKSGVDIWPHRYQKISPEINKLFGVSVPGLDELAGTSVTTSDVDLTTPVGVQKFLISKGYDLGPKGADGMIGPKTKAAILKFQEDHNLTKSGVVDSETRKFMLLS